MKKFTFLLLSVCLIFLFHCATDQKATQPAFVPDEKCDVPTMNVGDSWTYRNDNKKDWGHKIAGIEDFKQLGLWGGGRRKFTL